MAEEGKRKSVRKKNQTVNLDTLGLEMGNKPPQALDVEEAVLGALLIDFLFPSSAIRRIIRNQDLQVFFRSIHR